VSIETERKFLVKPNFPRQNLQFKKIHQGFLCDEPDRAVRVRISDEKAYITIKGKSNDTGTSRYEFETEIPVKDAESLLNLCINNIIEKTRYLFPLGNHTIEVDVFGGLNIGLILAEIELKDENEKFVKPEWIAEEVTGNVKYYNLYLAKNPYSKW